MVDLFEDCVRSHRNRRVRQVIALRDDPVARRREGAYLIEGIKLVREALTLGIGPRLVFVSPRLRREPTGARLLSTLRSGASDRLVPVTDAVLGALAATRTPQGVVAVVERPAAPSNLPSARPGRPLLVACGVQDPGNLGALLRSAVALGAAGVVTASGADPYHPRAVRAAAGALFHMTPAIAASGADLIADLHAGGYRSVAAVPRGGISLFDLDAEPPWALLVGAEGPGLAAGMATRAAARVSIPMEAGMESLAVPAAAAALLLEAMRRRQQRRLSHRPPAASRPRKPQRRRRGGRGGA